MSSVWNSTGGCVARGLAFDGLLLGKADAEGLDRTNGTARGLPMEVLQREFVLEDRLDKRK